MHNSSFHEKPFDEGTLCKLELYRRYIRTWLPVFINNRHIDRIQIFDFFAGPGSDSVGNPGSPLIAAEEIRKALDSNKSRLRSELKITLMLNEKDSEKYQILQKTSSKIRAMNPEIDVLVRNQDFQPLYVDRVHSMRQNRTANFLLLDQFGLKEVPQKIFHSLVSLDKTDFIFFVSAAIVNRMKEDRILMPYLPPIQPEEWTKMNGSNVTRILRDAYERWLPQNNQYFLGHFSIKKGGNVYGLIFGSHHPLGIYKFLNAAWKIDGICGEANFDIDGDQIDPTSPALFEDMNKPKKLHVFEKDLEDRLLQRVFGTNHDLFIFGLTNGMLPKHVKDLIKRLCNEKKIPPQKLNISYDAWNAPSQEIQYNREEGSL